MYSRQRSASCLKEKVEISQLNNRSMLTILTDLNVVYIHAMYWRSGQKREARGNNIYVQLSKMERLDARKITVKQKTHNSSMQVSPWKPCPASTFS